METCRSCQAFLLTGEAHCRICGFDGAGSPVPLSTLPPPRPAATSRPAPRGGGSGVATALRWVVGSVVGIVVGHFVAGSIFGASDPPPPQAVEAVSEWDIAASHQEAAGVLCTSQGSNPVADAEPYVPGGDVDRVYVLKEEQYHGGGFGPREHASREAFEARSADSFTLVACMSVAQPATEVETCTGYEGGATAKLMAGSFDLTLYEARSGRVVATNPGMTREPECDWSIPVGPSNTTTLWPDYDEGALSLLLYPYAMD